jgi:Spy/CpxP family protein refolding chaperone
MKSMWGVAVLGMTLAAGAPAMAGPEHGRGPGGRDGKHLHWLAEELGLTDEQEANWKALAEQNRTEMEPLRQEGRELREKLRAAVEAENPDPQTVGAATLALEQHRKAVGAAHKAFRERLNATLTPEQKTKLEALKAQRHERRGPDGFGRRGTPGRKPGPTPEPPAAPES